MTVGYLRSHPDTTYIFTPYDPAAGVQVPAIAQARGTATRSNLSAFSQKLTKLFAGVTALDDVDIVLNKGEVHALPGANGSGKSTFVKILTGVYQPDAGSLKIGDRVIAAIASPHEAAFLGIAVVHQEAPLIDTLSVAECVAVFRGYPTNRLGGIDWRRLRREADELLDQFGISLSLR